MNGLDEEQMGPQTFLYGCELKSGKDVVFNPEEDDFEHQLDLRMLCVDLSTKDELHIVEVEGQDTEGQKVKAVLASLKPSTLPSVCLGGFAITPPAVFRLKAGSGPIHISGQHLVMMGGDQSFDEDEDDEEEEEVQTSKKRPASAPALKSQKKMKMDVGDEDDEEDDDEDEDSEAEESPVKAKKTPSKPQTPAHGGKGSKANTPAGKQVKTPGSKGGQTPKNGQTPKATSKTPKQTLHVSELKVKMMATVEKGGKLPKLQSKFESFVRNSFKVTETKTVEELWQWRQTVEDGK
ncbi:nucleophosmin isoform X1 [Oncorhynchus mykiss]|uniref:Nucleophosmin n=1 Tax=Oncorhynchus mykiss TaxID=8022 RepID=A0A8C7VTZ2_ONCMY|nr:nucleophosmin isoform X1 [Oncorhynchus mykiss]